MWFDRDTYKNNTCRCCTLVSVCLVCRLRQRCCCPCGRTDYGREADRPAAHCAPCVIKMKEPATPRPERECTKILEMPALQRTAMPDKDQREAPQNVRVETAAVKPEPFLLATPEIAKGTEAGENAAIQKKEAVVPDHKTARPQPARGERKVVLILPASKASRAVRLSGAAPSRRGRKAFKDAKAQSPLEVRRIVSAAKARKTRIFR